MIRFEFYYLIGTDEEISATIFDELMEEYGPGRVSDWIEVVTIDPSQNQLENA